MYEITPSPPCGFVPAATVPGEQAKVILIAPPNSLPTAMKLPTLVPALTGWMVSWRKSATPLEPAVNVRSLYVTSNEASVAVSSPVPGVSSGSLIVVVNVLLAVFVVFAPSTVLVPSSTV